MLVDLIQKIKNKNSQCSLCDVKITSQEEWKKHIATEEHKENVKVDNLAWRKLYEDILLIS